MDTYLCRDCGTAEKETEVGATGLKTLECQAETDTGDTCGGDLVRVTNKR